MNHRLRPAPGFRPKRVNEERVCVVCESSFVLDRQAQPWSRARTCSGSCRAVLGNRNRTPETCDHCVMVEGYHHERCRQERARENGGFRDEDARLVQFRTWLEGYPWAPRDVVLGLEAA